MSDQKDTNPEPENGQNGSDQPSLKENLRARDTWFRALNMVLFLIIWWIAEALLIAVVIFQFLATLFARKTNAPLLNFGKSLSAFIYEVALFLSYGTDDRPFPFRDWPDADVREKGDKPD
jgi:hypothetical protein